MRFQIRAFVHGIHVDTFFCELDQTSRRPRIVDIDLTHIKAMNNGPPPHDRQSILPFLEDGHQPQMPR